MRHPGRIDFFRTEFLLAGFFSLGSCHPDCPDPSGLVGLQSGTYSSPANPSHGPVAERAVIDRKKLTVRSQQEGVQRVRYSGLPRAVHTPKKSATLLPTNNPTPPPTRLPKTPHSEKALTPNQVGAYPPKLDPTINPSQTSVLYIKPILAHQANQRTALLGKAPPRPL